MIPALREEFNRNFTPEKYQEFLQRARSVAARTSAFASRETPCFLPYQLIGPDGRATDANWFCSWSTTPITASCRMSLSRRSIRCPNEAPLPMFVQVDFGLVRNLEGELEPKLVELQAFPSLYGYQPTAAEQYVESFGLSRDLGIYLSGCDREAYWRLLRHLVVADHDPENVILMEIDPDNQKTLPDFLITQRELGIPVVDILKLIKRANKLFYKKDGREIEVRRIYNRCIVDELQRKNITLPFDFRDELDVEWAGHPNWYFRISKFSIPYLNHPSVPRTWFLDQLPAFPEDHENFLLKPLYSFAGVGIRFAPLRRTSKRSRPISAITTSSRSVCTSSL